MKKEALSDIIGELDDGLIENAPNDHVKRKRINFKRFITAAAAFVVIAAVLAAFIGIRPVRTPEPPSEETSGAVIARDASFAVVEAKYPDHGAYKNWRDSESDLNFSKDDYKDYPITYTEKTVSNLIGYADKNVVFSPLSLFFSLCSLAEMTENESREQILSLLGTNSTEELRKAAKALWLTNYGFDIPTLGEEGGISGQVNRSLSGSSFWLNADAEIDGSSDIAQTLKDNYFTSFYKGKISDEKYSEKLRDWLSFHTGGLLGDSVKEINFSDETLFMMLNTILYQQKWTTEFDPSKNFTGAFYSNKIKSDVTFMKEQGAFGSLFFEGDRFTAYGKRTESDYMGWLWFILPNENESVASVLESGEYKELLEAYANENYNRFTPREQGYDMYEVTASIPKFDVTSSINLKETLTSLGVTDVFSETKAEIPFIKMKNGENVYLTNASQDVRLGIDENGVSAAAITSIEGGIGDGSNPVIKYIDFVLDRPFIFVLTSANSSIPLFAGIINDPS